MIIAAMRLYHTQWQRTKKRVLSVVASGLVAIPTFSTAAGELNLVPWPRQVAEHGGDFFLNRQTVVTADAAFTNEAALLAEALELQRGSASTNCILLTTDGATGLGDEAYRLEVTPHGATIRALSPALTCPPFCKCSTAWPTTNSTAFIFT